jgi:hypothetical protein
LDTNLDAIARRNVAKGKVHKFFISAQSNFLGTKFRKLAPQKSDSINQDQCWLKLKPLSRRFHAPTPTAHLRANSNASIFPVLCKCARQKKKIEKKIRVLPFVSQLLRLQFKLESEKKRKLPHSHSTLTLSVRARYKSARAAFVDSEALKFDEHVRLLANTSKSVLLTHFGAQCEPQVRINHARPFEDGAHCCEAEIEFQSLQHPPHIVSALVAMVRERCGDCCPADRFEVSVIADDSRHSEWRTHAQPLPQPTQGQSINGASGTACEWLAREDQPVLPTTVAPLSGISSVLDIPILSFLLPQGRPSSTGERLAPLANYAKHTTLEALIGALAPAVLDNVEIKRRSYENWERDLNFELQPMPDAGDDCVKHFLFMAAPCGSGKTQAFLKLLSSLPRQLVRLLALQIRCSLISQLQAQLNGRNVTPVLYNNGNQVAQCDDDNDDNDVAPTSGNSTGQQQKKPSKIVIAKEMPLALAQFSKTPAPSAFIGTIHSAHHLQSPPPFTVMLLDEVRAQIDQVFSDANSGGMIQRDLSVLVGLTACAPLVVAADAYMGLETQLLAAAAIADYSARYVLPRPLGKKLVIHEHVVDYKFAARTNGAAQKRGTVVELPHGALEHKLIKEIKAGSRVWVYCDALKHLKKLRETVLREVPGIVDVQLHGEVRANEKAKLIANLTHELEQRNVSVVFATSTASIGVSVVGYFDTVFAFFTGRMPANEQLQALYRERAPRKGLIFVAWQNAMARALPLPLRTVGDVVRAHAKSMQRRLLSDSAVLSMLESVQTDMRRLSIEFSRPLTLQLLRDDGFEVLECERIDGIAQERSVSSPVDKLRALASSIEAAVANDVALHSFRFVQASNSRLFAASVVAYQRQLDALEALVQVAFGTTPANEHSNSARFARMVHNLALVVHPDHNYQLGLFGGACDLEWSGDNLRRLDCPWLTHPVQTATQLTTEDFLAWIHKSEAKTVVQMLYGRDAARWQSSSSPLSRLRSFTNLLFGDTCMRAPKKNKGPTIAWRECARALDLLARSRLLPVTFLEWRHQHTHGRWVWIEALREEAEFNERQPACEDSENARIERCIELLKAHEQFVPYSTIAALKCVKDAEPESGAVVAVKRPRRAAAAPCSS